MLICCYGRRGRFISDDAVLLRCVYENASKPAGDASVLALRRKIVVWGVSIFSGYSVFIVFN
ncbi:hypothetical protein B194_1211 [Serratia plymuthica A30]|nr:hypothetical protein B194_1211 [Serratia plymuthica A30]